MELDSQVQKKAKYWCDSPEFDKLTRQEITQLFQNQDFKELTNRFYRDLEFGTGGMRGIMGAGSYRLNVYNIRKATMALVNYLWEFHGKEATLQVAISYDSRNNSRFFAQSAAEVLAACGLKVLLTNEMRPVPMLSFMVRHYECQAGICITASHNPPAYNGFKVYWEGGGQLVPPHDKKIMSCYEQIKSYKDIPYMAFDEACKKNLITIVSEDLDLAYFQKISELRLRKSEPKDLKIVYSPLHGTGIYSVPRALKIFGFQDVHIIAEQEKPDGNFPTVASPNPEDESALALSLKLGKSLQADILLATDPDGDRVGVMVREGSEWVRFNGNQVGSLLYEYVFSSLSYHKTLPAQSLAVKTVVTTDLQKEIAHYYGASCEETLTGFKWIGDLIESYETRKKLPYRQFICGGEESYGFLTGNFVRDKDATIACVLICEMMAYYKSLGKTLTQVLDELFLRHQVYIESLFTLELPGKDGSERIKRIMDQLRSHPPLMIGQHKVDGIKDYLSGKSTRVGSDQIGDLDFPKENMIQLELPLAKISVRPSGTEPKIKVYTSVFMPVLKSQLSKIKEDAKNNLLSLEAEITKIVHSIL